MLSSREIIIYLAVTFKGDWRRIYNFASNHYELPSDEEMLSVINRINSKVITILDEEYPENLRNAVQPPFALFYHGDISLLNNYENTISIIGTREPSQYGINVTKKIVNDLEGRYTIVSGMALGIDSLAQETTMGLGGKTIAVLGCGINNCYISTLIGLYNEIKERHLVISEYPENTPPTQMSFPYRNRIIAALGKCLLVTEARAQSGTSTTVGYAIMGQTNVLAVPTNVTEDSLCNVLIQEGAALVRNAFDVMDEMDGKKYSVIFPPR